jgi:hypothetical protein
MKAFTRQSTNTGKVIIRNCFLIVLLSHRSDHALEDKTQLSQILLLNLYFIFRVYVSIVEQVRAVGNALVLHGTSDRSADVPVVN